jgi:hypothetical protein
MAYAHPKHQTSVEGVRRESVSKGQCGVTELQVHKLGHDKSQSRRPSSLNLSPATISVVYTRDGITAGNIPGGIKVIQDIKYEDHTFLQKDHHFWHILNVCHT